MGMKKQDINALIDEKWDRFLNDNDPENLCKLTVCGDHPFCLSKGKDALDNLPNLKEFENFTYQELKEKYMNGDDKLKALFTLISYCDTYALDGKKLNEYSIVDSIFRRVVALSGVFMDKWTSNFIKYSNTKSIDNLAPSVRNAINYLNDPEHHLSITSDNHYKMLYEFFFDEPLKKISDNDKKKLLYEIKSYISDSFFECFSNRFGKIFEINKTMLITYFLYYIREKWEKKD